MFEILHKTFRKAIAYHKQIMKVNWGKGSLGQETNLACHRVLLSQESAGI